MKRQNMLLTVSFSIMVLFMLQGCTQELPRTQEVTGQLVNQLGGGATPQTGYRCTPCSEQTLNDPDGVCQDIGGTKYLVYCDGCYTGTAAERRKGDQKNRICSYCGELEVSKDKKHTVCMSSQTALCIEKTTTYTCNAGEKRTQQLGPLHKLVCVCNACKITNPETNREKEGVRWDCQIETTEPVPPNKPVIN